MQARLQDVAARAQVSMQTVSRVLRAPNLVAPATAARVRAVMDEMGYVRNAQATALRLGRTRTIGLLFQLHDSLPMPFPLEVIAGAEEHAVARGYSLVMYDTSGTLEDEAEVLALLLSQRVAGVIYTGPRCRPETHPACATLLASGVPVVVISSDPHDLPYKHVRTDDVRAGYVAVRHLLDVGRQRLAIVAAAGAALTQAFAAWPAISDRLDGAAAALREAGLAADDAPLYLAPNTAEGGRGAGAMILAGARPLPDGIAVTTDIMALGLLEALRAAGVRVPEDIAVVGHDDLFTASIAVPSLTTIAPPRRQMGHDCVDLLLRTPAGTEGTDTHLLDAELIVRESTIGSGPAAREGLRVPVSHEEAWSAWRQQVPALHADRNDAPPVAVHTLGQREEVTRLQQQAAAALRRSRRRGRERATRLVHE